MHDDELIDGLDRLPSLPMVLHRMSAVVADHHSSAGDVEEVLKLDPAMAGRVLKLANSVYVGVPRTVSSLRNAVALLGMKRVHSVVLAAGINRMMNGAHAFDDGVFGLHSFWRHSVTVGIVCESVARHMQRYEPIEPTELFSAGILHDIGKLAVGVVAPGQLTAGRNRALREKIPFFRAETEDWRHDCVGGRLASRWNLPNELVHGIRFHHFPSEAHGFHRTASLVHLADVMVHMVGFATWPYEEVPELDENILSVVPLPLERLKVIAMDALENTHTVDAMVGAVG